MKGPSNREGSYYYPFTKLEQDYKSCLNEILLKPEWFNKINDVDITDVWKREIALRYTSSSETLFKYLFAELHFLSSQRLSINIGDSFLDFCPTAGHGIYWGTARVPSQILDQFNSSALILESISFKDQKFHPDSKNVQLDLIHPSNCCLVFNRSLVASRTTQQLTGDSIAHFSEIFSAVDRRQKNSSILKTNNIDVSEKFQWIPSDVHVDDLGRVQFLSYINDLDPMVYNDMEKSLGSILSLFIPLFELAIASFQTEPPRR